MFLNHNTLVFLLSPYGSFWEIHMISLQKIHHQYIDDYALLLCVWLIIPSFCSVLILEVHFVSFFFVKVDIISSILFLEYKVNFLIIFHVGIFPVVWSERLSHICESGCGYSFNEICVVSSTEGALSDGFGNLRHDNVLLKLWHPTQEDTADPNAM